MVERAEEALARAIEAKGKDAEVAYPNTAYYLPIMYLFLGQRVQKLGDLEESLQEARKLLRPIPEDELWLPYLGDTLDCGVATLIAEETIEALKFVMGNPVEGIWLSFTDDSTLRLQGIKLVDGRMPGFAAIVGCTETNEEAVRLVRGLQERNILVFMAGHTNGRAIAEQLAEENIQMDWDTFLVPYGKDITAAVHALNFAARSAMTFGGIEPKGLKEAREILLYNLNRVHAFVWALGADEAAESPEQVITDEKYATAAGAINFGFPVISNVNIPEILPTGICRYEHVVANVPMDEIISRSVEIRGLTIRVEKVPIPVPYGAGFEGERVRKEDMYVQFGGKYTVGFEWLRMRPMEEITDGKVEVIGPEIDEMTEGQAYPLGIVVDVAGRNFQEDFESVLERRIHEYISCANGIFHMGQRAITWVRISKDAYAKGFRIEHFGTILVTRLHNDFSAIVDRVQVTIYTDPEKIKAPLEEARAAYRKRDDRIGGMTDEDVEEFYSCTLCQSYAPDHVCIVTPQRLGLCGAYTWLDCKASYQINPHGPNEPVAKGKCIDPKLGQWENINKYIAVKSNGNLQKFSAYSMLVDPMTSCGCFECIAAIMPEANGVIIVDRDFQGMTPIGMKFSTLAGQIGGGVQTPGFIGIGKLYITSPKFISAEGGIERVVWMPKALKEEIAERLKARLEEIGKPELFDKIATEEDATEPDQLVEFLQKVEHPALTMESLL